MDMQILRAHVYAGQYDEHELTALPCAGESPWGGMECREGVWAWDEDRDEVLVGDDDLDVVSYDDARRIYGA